MDPVILLPVPAAWPMREYGRCFWPEGQEAEIPTQKECQRKRDNLCRELDRSNFIRQIPHRR